MTTLPPLCSPANLSRSPSTRPLLPRALLLLLAARGVLPVFVVALMNGSAGVAAFHAHGDNFSRPGGPEPISVPPELEPISASLQSLPFALKQEERSQNLVA
jgi:hypothetical protein